MVSLRKILGVVLLATVISLLESTPHNLRNTRLANLIRRRRSPVLFYNPWTPPYLTASIKIPVQQVLGTVGKQPLYLPPQSLNLNAGFPVDNPPSVNGTHLSNKFDFDGQPVWGMSDDDKTTTTTKKPDPSASQSVQPENLPSRCVWAIISCCSASSNAISYDCFEQLGCNGAFWGDSPCDGDIARSAISNVMNYYQTN